MPDKAASQNPDSRSITLEPGQSVTVEAGRVSVVVTRTPNGVVTEYYDSGFLVDHIRYTYL